MASSFWLGAWAKKHAFFNTPDANPRQEPDRQHTEGLVVTVLEGHRVSAFLLLHQCRTRAKFLPVKRAHSAPLATAMAGSRWSLGQMTFSEEIQRRRIKSFTPFCGVRRARFFLFARRLSIVVSDVLVTFPPRSGDGGDEPEPSGHRTGPRFAARLDELGEASICPLLGNVYNQHGDWG